MYHPNSPSKYSRNMPYQQQFGPRFQTPSQQFTQPASFYQSSHSHCDHSRPPCQAPAQPQSFYQPENTNLRPRYQSPNPNFESSSNPQYSSLPAGPSFNQPPFITSGPPVQNYNQPPIQTYNQPPVQNYNQPPIQNYNQPPPVQNYNQPAPVQNYNQPPVQNFNNHPPIQNFNHLPPIQNFNQPATSPYQSTNQNCHQQMNSPYQPSSAGYGTSPSSTYQPRVQSPETLKRPYQLPANQQQHPTFNSSRHEFNQRPPFRPSTHQSFSFKNPPRYQPPQHGNNRFQFQPRQQYQNFHPRGPPLNFNNHSNSNGVPKKDKLQIACDMGDCDFVGHASAVKEHQNMHHRLGLHKKVLYSNNSDAVKNWIEERKKKWPTKETIQTKSIVEDEKNKRGERIADEDFQRFNNKNNKFNNSGSRRFNNRKRPRFNGEYTEPVEEPFNGKLKRFAGIDDILKKEEEDKIEETNKSVFLKLLVEYDESSNNESDNDAPEETAIEKEPPLTAYKSLTGNDGELCSTAEIDVSLEQNKEIDSTSLVVNDSESVNKEVQSESCSKVNEESEKINSAHGLKRKKNSKKEFKPIKRLPPPRTPRTEVVERKGALLEALMGDLMRRERNTITQCICYIRNNMHRFSKIQAA